MFPNTDLITCQAAGSTHENNRPSLTAMNYRGYAKYLLHSYVPGMRGWFKYFGTRTYFPANSHLFQKACAQGIYESDLIRGVMRTLQPNSYYFDIGANIGLTSIPVLQNFPNIRVLSAEPSPASLNCLRLTHSKSQWQERWTIEDRAISDTSGQISFTVANPSMGAFDGIRDTQRVGGTKQITITTTTLDEVWQAMNTPAISVVKIDIEGAEMLALRGADSLINQQRPFIFVEWNNANLAAYQLDASILVQYARERHYSIRVIPTYIKAENEADLAFQMLSNELFLLCPNEKIPR